MGVLDYSGSITITFDKAIVSEPGQIYNQVPQSLGTIIYTSQSRPASYGFDDSTGSKWEPSSAYPQHLGKNYGSAKTIGKMRVYLGGGYVPNAYKVRGSSNGSTWVDIASGNFTNVTGWQEVIFTPVSYQYWCLQILSAYNTYTWVYELQFYEPLSSFPTEGWTVTGYEPSMIPDGALVPTTYTVKRVSKSEDGLSIILWLNLLNRLKYPQGLVTVQYNKVLGNLAGAFSSLVEDFSISFSPSNITPTFKPNDVENISVSLSAIAAVSSITYWSTKEEENISVTLSAVAAVTHINDLEQ